MRDRNEEGRAGRRRAARLRDAGGRAGAPGVDLRRRGSSACAPAWTSAATTASSSGPIASTAPTSPTSPGSILASRRRCLVVGRSGDPAMLVGNECFATAEAAPLPLRCVRFQDLSLPAQPRDSSMPLAEILGAEGITSRHPRRRRRVEDVRQPGRRWRRRRSSSTSCAGRPARRVWWRTPPTCSSTPPTGCA